MTGYVHASALAVGECGVLVRGPPGAGKSGLVLALLALAPQFGQFARLIGDDRIGLSVRAGRIVMRPHPAIAGQIEARGRGILALPFLPAAVAGLVVEISNDQERAERLPDAVKWADVLGVSLPLMTLRSRIGSTDGALAVLARQGHAAQNLSFPEI